jgi:DNA helicase-2/ATP-dependent DNA helicase PcrA
MKFIADLHVHSHFSRATAKNLDLENLYIAAQLKGITVIGTGDFTHPGWLAEIKEKLVPAESGMFRLTKEFSSLCDQKVPKSCRRDVRFILVSEISNIYKKNKKTRKNHNLVFLSDFNQADNFVSKLDKIGNIRSDGRPILGLDARDLLEMLLETDDQAFLIPAHIWTPWFSLLGSKSGFDSIDECFEDLTPYIFAVETGLSSDPEMNWRVSELDRMTLISNSDAHSPLKLGREANLFDTQLSFSAIKSAIQSGDPERFVGTLEFYPEEGKYHLDGHRNCHVRSWPDKTRKAGGLCPVCKKPMTLGVLYRVEELADRPSGVKPKNFHPYFNTVPLVEILSEVLKVGPNSKKVMETYRELLEKLGSELDILTTLDKDRIGSAGIPLLGEAITKVRQNDIVLLPGYDGEFGKIKIFNSQERQKLEGQKPLFFVNSTRPIQKKHKKEYQKPTASMLFHKFSKNESQTPTKEKLRTEALNSQQRLAVENNEGAMVIIAGPGTGKTRTLTQKMAFLILEKDIPPENILAVTFTNKAALEMRRRLEMLLKKSNLKTFVGTFHGLCFHILKQQEKYAYTIIDEKDRELLLIDAVRQVKTSNIPINIKPKQLLKQIIFAKQNLMGPHEGSKPIDDPKEKSFHAVYQSYQELLDLQKLCDYEDLIFKTVRLLETKNQITDSYRRQFQHVFVDEYQDLNHGQYRIIKALVPPGNDKKICVVGDPNQSIYGFRGSSSEYFKRFVQDYPDAQVIKLTQNYRSTQTILDGSYQVIQSQGENSFKEHIYSEIDGKKTISVIEAGSEKSEAVAIGKTIEQLMGGTGFHSMDFGHVKEGRLQTNFGFSDFAVLYRTSEQNKVLSQIFDAAGIPYQIVSRENIFNSKCIGDLVSLIKVVEGTGSFADFERSSRITTPAMNKKSLEIFKNWCIKKRLSLESALVDARRFPIKEMGKTLQTKLFDVTGEIFKIKDKTKNMSMGEKLVFLSEYTRLSRSDEWDQKTMDALKHMIDLYTHSDVDTKDFLKTSALQTDTDMYQHQSERVALMTMHASKGLEFPVVFICGCENGLLPFQHIQQKDDGASDTEEERRLFYVAMTRAEQRLFITFSKTRKRFGKIEKQTLSPFVHEIEENLIARETMAPPKKTKTGQRQLKLF